MLSNREIWRLIVDRREIKFVARVIEEGDEVLITNWFTKNKP